MSKKQFIAEPSLMGPERVLVSSGSLHIKPDKHKPLTQEICFNKRIAEGVYVSLQRVPDADARWLVDALSLGVQWMSGEAFLGCKRNAHPMRTNDRPLQRKRDSFRSLVEALDDHWDKSFDVLPPRAKVRVLRDFGPGHWDNWNAEQRKSLATQRDYQHDPATKAERERVWGLVSKASDLKAEIRKLKLMAVHSPLERESKERQLADLRERLDAIVEQQAAPAESNSGNDTNVQAVASATASNAEGLKKREKQMRAIEVVADELGYTRLAIPDGGKKGIKAKCMTDHTRLFGGGGDPFKEAWQAAVSATPPRIRMKNHDRYSKGK